MANKGPRAIVKLQSTESDYFVTTTRNTRTTEKLKLRKFDPKAKKHALFEEKKIK